MRKLLGRSPKEEITRVQLEKAKQLLVETDLSAAAIAKQCGYSQPKYFSQVFHARVGLAPSLYRRDQKRFPRGTNREFLAGFTPLPTCLKLRAPILPSKPSPSAWN